MEGNVVQGEELTAEDKLLISRVRFLAQEIINKAGTGTLTLKQSKVIGGVLFLATDKGEYIAVSPDNKGPLGYASEANSSRISNAIEINTMKVIAAIMEGWLLAVED